MSRRLSTSEQYFCQLRLPARSICFLYSFWASSKAFLSVSAFDRYNLLYRLLTSFLKAESFGNHPILPQPSALLLRLQLFSLNLTMHSRKKSVQCSISQPVLSLTGSCLNFSVSSSSYPTQSVLLGFHHSSTFCQLKGSVAMIRHEMVKLLTTRKFLTLF